MCLAKSKGVSPLASCVSMSAPCLMRQLRHCKWAPEAAKWAGVAPEPTTTIPLKLILKKIVTCVTQKK